MIMAEETKSLKSSPLKRPWQGYDDHTGHQCDQNSILDDISLNETNKRIKDDREDYHNGFGDAGLLSPPNQRPDPTDLWPDLPPETKDLLDELPISVGDVELTTNGYHRENSASSGTDESAEINEAMGSNDVTQQQDDSDDDDEDDNVSEISDLSGISIEAWRPQQAGPMSWVQRQMMLGQDPRPILQSIIPNDTLIPAHLDELTMWKIIINILSEPPKRKKLDHVNTLEDVVDLFRSCKNVMVLTGAGVSVSCGIPDFRSRDGVYARLAVEYPDLPDPQAMFDINYFRRDPRPFYKFAKEIYPGQFKPSPCHRFIKLLEDHGKLLRNYTQNIDTLEQVAGISNVIQCHGSFARATCMTCKYQVDAEAIKEDIMNQVIPKCPRCSPTATMPIMKPDIVFFGENLPGEFHRQMEIDKDECDLLIVIGSSLKVRPVALVPNSLPADVPQILINREPLKHLNFDVELLGDCDVIVNELCHRLGNGWSHMCTTAQAAVQTTPNEMPTPPVSDTVSERLSPMSMMDDNSRMSMQAVDYSLHPANRQDSINSEESSSASASNMNVDSGESNCTTSNMVAEENSCMSISSLDVKTPTQTNLSANHTVTSSSVEHISADKMTNQGLDEANDTFTHNQEINRTSQHGTATENYVSPQSSFHLITDSLSSRKEEADSSTMVERHEADTTSANQNEDETSTNQSTSKMDDLRACWQPRYENISKCLPESTFLYMEPKRYIFHGAEVKLDQEEDNFADLSDNQSDSSDDLSSDHDQVTTSMTQDDSHDDIIYNKTDAAESSSNTHTVTVDESGLN